MIKVRVFAPATSLSIRPMQPQRHYIPTLDGWRSVAIIFVLLCHGLTLSHPSARFEKVLNPLVMNLGQQGVSLFFAISGYLITTLLLSEYQATGGISLRGFYTRRIFRILPPAYTYLAVIATLGAVGVLSLTHSEIPSALFVYNNYWPSRSWFTQHFWSLSMEEHFYLLWPALLALCGLRRARWVALAGILLTIFWRPFGLHAIHLAVPELERTDMRLDAFLFACLLALLVHNNRALQKHLATPVFHYGVLAVLMVGYAFALVYPMQLTKLAFQSFMLPLVIVPTTLMPAAAFSRFLELPLLRWFGRISYSVYLWQQLILHGDGTDLRSALLGLTLKIPAILLIASASYYWIERPCIKKGRLLSSDDTKSSAETAFQTAIR